ncbi:Werner Syndrome-like exonuclease [Ipomoea triloba]|uniref:Werner Syndrome-like exonuclease n=1 Tax=Ipomoea triloba TaxID=35885 RepID=UPI00125E1B7A|nr:Werner Syndrome-like exonuclease [Ipomoea triloba]
MDIGIVEYVNGFHDIYNVHFNGECIRTLVTPEPRKVIEWISEIEYIHRHRLNRLIVGLDVEWRPSYSKRRNPVATLQLCVGRRCLVFQLLYCGPRIPDRLVRFLGNPGYSFVGVGIKDDLKKLEEDHRVLVTNAVELRALAAYETGDASLKNVGLKYLVGVYLGAEMEKPRRVRMGEWDREVLNTEQIQYACIDAFVCFEIGRILKASAH